MHDLSFPVVAPEEVLSDRFRVHAVNGDAMEPTLRGGRDYALLAPVASWRQSLLIRARARRQP
ncbi:hypothetical protein ACVI1N_000742 [Sinorhizobium medicae]